MLQDHVRALLDQSFGCVRFFGWIKPSVNPDDFELDVRVHLFRVDVGRVDAADNFWDRERGDVTNGVGFGHLAGDMALNRAAFVEACGVDGHVFSGLIASCVLEFHVREFLCDVVGWVHVAERSGEDQVRTLQRHLSDCALCVRTFRHVFLIEGFDLVTEGFFDCKTTLVVLVGPATVAHWANVDEADFGGVSGSCRRQPNGHGRRGQKFCEFHEVYPPLLVVYWPRALVRGMERSTERGGGSALVGRENDKHQNGDQVR